MAAEASQMSTLPLKNPVDSNVVEHCAIIEECNQRGGRMLSVIDLIRAGTITPELAAYAFAAIRKGCSFLVGAVPGGAGKTTVMGAMLNFVPRDVKLVAADSMATLNSGLAESVPRKCYVCHEIGTGPYYAYLWGEELRRYFELAHVGHMLATNLHADTIEQAYDQICVQNQVPLSLFYKISIIFFLSARFEGGRVARTIGSAYESDGRRPHLLLWDGTSFGNRTGTIVSPEEMRRAQQTIQLLVESGATTQHEVRSFLVNNGFV